MATAIDSRHKRSRSATHRSSSPWDLSSRRTPGTVTKLSMALSPTQQHVSSSEHAPRRPPLPPGLKPGRSSSLTRAAPVVSRPPPRPAMKKRRATMVTPRTAAMCLAFEGVSIANAGDDTEGSSSSGGLLIREEEALQAVLSPCLRNASGESSSSGSSARLTSRPTPNPAPPKAEAMPVVYMGEPRLQTSSAYTSPSTSTSHLVPLPPSPIPSFPPYTPKDTPGNDFISVGAPADEHTIEATASAQDAPIDHTDPAFFIVPSTCDKRRRDAVGGGAFELMDGATGPRPMKKLKQANGKATAPRLSTSSLPELIMPTAIDVVDFIDRRGGTCYEGDVFMRFRTGESEHVRSVVNEIIQVFARVDVGRDGSRWLTLTPGIAA